MAIHFSLPRGKKKWLLTMRCKKDDVNFDGINNNGETNRTSKLMIRMDEYIQVLVRYGW